jgi:hypothetical protein
MRTVPAEFVTRLGIAVNIHKLPQGAAEKPRAGLLFASTSRNSGLINRNQNKNWTKPSKAEQSEDRQRTKTGPHTYRFSMMPLLAGIGSALRGLPSY